MPWFEELHPKERLRLSDKISSTFHSVDKDHNGKITPAELEKLLKQVRGFEKWSDEDFEVFFRNADWDNDEELNWEEFVDWILELDIPQLYGPGMKRYPVYRAREITYPNGVTVPMKVVLDDLKGNGTSRDSPPVASKLRKFMRSKKYNKTLHRHFVEADTRGEGELGWNNREIYNFGMLCMNDIGCPSLGGDEVFYRVYRHFDFENNGKLDQRECHYMMDMVFRALACHQRETDPGATSAEEEDDDDITW